MFGYPCENNRKIGAQGKQAEMTFEINRRTEKLNITGQKHPQ